MVDYKEKCAELKKTNDELRKEVNKWKDAYDTLYQKISDEDEDNRRRLKQAIIEALEWCPPYRVY